MRHKATYCVSCKSWLVKVHFPPRGTARSHTQQLFQSSSSEDYCGVTCARGAAFRQQLWPASENFGQFQAKRVKWPDRAAHTVKDPDSDEALDRFHWPSAIYALFSVIRALAAQMNGRWAEEPLWLFCCRIFMENQQIEWQDARRCPAHACGPHAAWFGFWVVINFDYIRPSCPSDFCCAVSFPVSWDVHQFVNALSEHAAIRQRCSLIQLFRFWINWFN